MLDVSNLNANVISEYSGSYSVGLEDSMPMQAELLAALRPAVEACFDRLVAEFGLTLDDANATAPLVGMIGSLVTDVAIRSTPGTYNIQRHPSQGADRYTIGEDELLPMQAEVMAALTPAIEQCFDRLVEVFGLSVDNPNATAPLVGMMWSLAAKTAINTIPESQTGNFYE